MDRRAFLGVVAVAPVVGAIAAARGTTQAFDVAEPMVVGREYKRFLYSDPGRRNAVEIEWSHGNSVLAFDSDSQMWYGQRYMYIDATDDESICTPELARRLAEAIVADLA